MHYNRIFKTMYTFYQAFMTTKCSLVCSSKYYLLHLERWHAKVKKPHRNRVWLRTKQEKNAISICCPIQPYTPDQAAKHPLPAASFLLLYHHHCPHLPNGENATHTLGVAENIIKSCTSTGLGSSVSFTVKPSLTISLFYLIAAIPLSKAWPILLIRHHFS